MTTAIENRELSVLFVDDEPCIIRGLMRNVSSLAKSWDVQLATSGQQALDILQKERVDVIVSDLRMPEMNGAQFLAQARRLKPNTMRIILSGYASEKLLLASTRVAHRYLTKPCDTPDLVRAISQVFETQKILRNTDVARFVHPTTELHADNEPLQEILKATNSAQCDIGALEAVISRYPTLHVSVLHIANTGFFGGGGSIDTLNQALQILGLNLVRSLAILELTRSRCSLPPSLRNLLDAILAHSVACSQTSRQLRVFASDPKMIESLGSAALLHDLGKVVLLIREREGYAALLRASFEQRRPLWQLERERYGCDHAAVGAYLLKLWGFPEAVVRSVAGHHEPTLFADQQVCPVSLLHLANVAAHNLKPTQAYGRGQLCDDLLASLGIDRNFSDHLN